MRNLHLESAKINDYFYIDMGRSFTFVCIILNTKGKYIISESRRELRIGEI